MRAADPARVSARVSAMAMLERCAKYQSRDERLRSLEPCRCGRGLKWSVMSQCALCDFDVDTRFFKRAHPNIGGV